MYVLVQMTIKQIIREREGIYVCVRERERERERERMGVSE